MTERYFPGRWFVDHATREILYLSPHYRSEGQAYDRTKVTIVIPLELQNNLIEFLDGEGFIKPKMTNESRVEDLKVTHRLLDILDKSINK